MKWHDKENKISDPNQYNYHQLISSYRKVFKLKDKIMKLYKNRDIVFDNETMTSNLEVVMTFPHSYPMRIVIKIRFSKLMAVQVTIFSPTKIINSYNNKEKRHNNKGWVLITC